MKAGDVVDPSQKIGLMGNTGFVFPAPSQSCPHCGTHTHFAARLWRQGSYVFTDYKSGWIDPVPLMYRPGDRFRMSFTRDLLLGSSGHDVAWLQTILKIEGFGAEYQPIGRFGPKTMRDVRLLQKKIGIEPSIGYVGPKTRNWLIQNYSL